MLLRTVSALSLGQLFAWGTLYYSFAVCLPFMRDDLGQSKTSLAAGFSLALLVSGMLAPVVGRWIDRRGSWGLMVVGAWVGGAGIVLWGLSTGPLSYLFAWLLIGVGMATTLYEPAFATVVRLDARHRRTALTTVTLVGALASTLFLPGLGALFETVGWRAGLIGLGVVFAVLGSALNASVPWFESSPRAPPQPGPSHARFLWVLGASLMLANGVSVAVNTYAVVFLVHNGLSVGTAAALVGGAGLGKFVGRIFVLYAGRWRASHLLRLVLAAQALGLLTPLLIPGPGALALMLAVFGATSGARSLLRPLLIIETFGDRGFGAKNGTLQLFSTLAKSGAPVMAGLSVDLLGFENTWGLLAMAMAGSAAMTFGLPRSAVNSAQHAHGKQVAPQ